MTAACPICGHVLRPFLAPLELPIFCNVLLPTADAAREAPRGSLELAICTRCGMIRNVLFDESLAGYGAGYENALHFSGVFSEFAREIADGLVERYDVRGARVVEIGCGDGHFLKLLCEAGGNRGVGYDPSRPPSTEATAGGGSYRIVSEPYLPGTAVGAAELVCARHVLEHIAEPRPFMRSVREAGAGEGVLYLEVPDGEYMLREGAFWDVIYEHCSYFTAGSLTALLSATGYEVLAIDPAFGGQYLCAEARPSGSRSEGEADLATDAGALVGLAESFDERRRVEVDRWDSMLAGLLADGGRVALWGAGSKGVTFACALERGAEIDTAVDVNPRKHGMHLPVTAVPVLSPEELRSRAPDHVLVMNANYIDEIAGTLGSLGLTPRLWTV